MLRGIRDSLSPLFGAPSVFAPDRTTVLQRITHSCLHCKGLVFELDVPPETSLRENQTSIIFQQDVILYDALRLACTTDCPLFKSLFKPEALALRTDWAFEPDGRFKDEYEPLCFGVRFRPSHPAPSGADPKPPELFVKVRRSKGRDMTSERIGDYMRGGPAAYTLFCARASGDKNSGFWFPKTPQLNLGNQQSLDDVRRKLDLCRRTHGACRAAAATPQALARPKRLLEIDTTTKRLRVIPTVGGHVEYAALSYCWGTSQRMLTSDTLAKLQSGVHPNFFSQSLQDAIKVVLACGLRHLWVDAICILQDDPSEMALEIQNMGDIYYGASFTVAAANSATNKQGFLRGTSQDAYPISLSNHDGTKTHLMMTPHPDVFQSGSEHPLHTRGWALQEAYFSRRYVQFGLHSVTVECATTTTDSGGTAWGVNSNPPLRLTQPTTLETSPSDWDGVIQMYSSRRLTMPSDKLVAISAMAKDAARRLHDPRPENYLAGLWRQNLARGLLWEMKDDPQPRPTCYRAPSWSWASVDGKVDVATADISNYRLTVLDAATSWDTMTGPFSAVTEGFVLVRAQMMNISGCVVYKDWKIQFYDISGHLDAAEPSLLHDSDQRPSMWLVLGLEERSRVATGGIPSDRYFEDDDVRVFGLVLMENADGQSYRRIGSFSAEHVDL